MMRELRYFRIQTRLMDPKIQQLGCLQWQNKIQYELLSHFQSITTCVPDTMLFMSNAQRLDDIGRLLDEYVFLEQVSLLELAVWKAACIMQLDEEDDEKSEFAADEPKPKRRTLLEVLEWMNTGWKSQKAKTRSSNSIEVIMVAVLPFLK
jgi:hypothetical protein